MILSRLAVVGLIREWAKTCGFDDPKVVFFGTEKGCEYEIKLVGAKVYDRGASMASPKSEPQRKTSLEKKGEGHEILPERGETRSPEAGHQEQMARGGEGGSHADPRVPADPT